ncbi:unnamed protein product, partial [Bubo scandiacus]
LRPPCSPQEGKPSSTHTSSGREQHPAPPPCPLQQPGCGTASASLRLPWGHGAGLGDEGLRGQGANPVVAASAG